MQPGMPPPPKNVESQVLVSSSWSVPSELYVYIYIDIFGDRKVSTELVCPARTTKVKTYTQKHQKQLHSTELYSENKSCNAIYFPDEMYDDTRQGYA